MKKIKLIIDGREIDTQKENLEIIRNYLNQ